MVGIFVSFFFELYKRLALKRNSQGISAHQIVSK